MPKGKKDLRKFTYAKKLKWVENEMIVRSDVLMKAFDETLSLADMRVSIQAARAMMQSIRDQVRYHAGSNKELEEVEEEFVPEV